MLMKKMTPMTPVQKIVIVVCVVVVVVAVVVAITLVAVYSKPGSGSSGSSGSGSPVYGCDATTGTCRAGLGSMTQQDCASKSKAEQLSFMYGCNPASGKCEPGFGQMAASCEHTLCEKLTWQCDQQNWLCKDTSVVTGISQTDCQCDPGLTASSYALVDAPNLPNQQGTNCKYGWTLDKSGNVVDTCFGNYCCASNYCGSFVTTDAYSSAVCPTITDPNDCTIVPLGHACQWDAGQSVCQAVAYDVGQCTACSQDSQCVVNGQTGKCVNQVCQLSLSNQSNQSSLSNHDQQQQQQQQQQNQLTCMQFPQGIQPVAPGLYPPAIQACEAVLNSQPLPDNSICSQMTDAYQCNKTNWQSQCSDKTGKVWYKKTSSCAAF